MQLICPTVTEVAVIPLMTGREAIGWRVAYGRPKSIRAAFAWQWALWTVQAATGIPLDIRTHRHPFYPWAAARVGIGNDTVYLPVQVRDRAGLCDTGRKRRSHLVLAAHWAAFVTNASHAVIARTYTAKGQRTGRRHGKYQGQHRRQYMSLEPVRLDAEVMRSIRECVRGWDQHVTGKRDASSARRGKGAYVPGVAHPEAPHCPKARADALDR